MPHKITLTGKPVSSLRQKGAYYTFDMEEKGSPAAPKGLPKSSTITYTVFINQKQLKKANLTEENIQAQKIMLQGEPTLDVPVEDCPGEIGVVCFQVSIVPEKQKEKELSKDSQEPEKDEVKAEEKTKGPEGTEDFILLEKISVPEEFLNSTPNPEKTQKVVDYVKRTGYLDEPITINRDTKVLTDGYRRYIVAKKVKLDLVPVVYEK
ncbi:MULTISPECIES: plasmid stabilization protein [Bacillaceae]|uniref:plasmid stabilization protein n=1 Tax=Bacillaceae TaxID=186817 RepID=UPI00178314C2|nr:MULTISPECIES: plasmid stabilization protein [Bacillaceae]MBD8068140.1 plasmid stabilization protein [Bacillus sp. PS06]